MLGLGHLQGIFYLLGIGLALAFAAFLAELLPLYRREDLHKPKLKGKLTPLPSH